MARYLLVGGLALVAGLILIDSITSRPASGSIGTGPAASDQAPSGATVNGPILFGRWSDGTETMALHATDHHGTAESLVLPDTDGCARASRDGRLISAELGWKTGRSRVGIFDLDGELVAEVADPVLSFACATWAPDGSTLAMIGADDTDGTRNGIYLASADGGGVAVQLTSVGSARLHRPVDFSPDGRSLLYFEFATGTKGRLMIVDVERGGPPRAVIQRVLDAGASWSRDGQWIVADARTEFLVMRPDGSGLRTLNVPDTSLLGAPVFSPDGTRILFNMAGPSDTLVAGSDIFTMGLDGTNLVQVTRTPEISEVVQDWAAQP
jgi:Tol biopolymer transport system component